MNSRLFLFTLSSLGLAILVPSCQDEEKVERLQEEVRQMGESQRETDTQISQFKSQIETLKHDKKRNEEEYSKLKETLEAVRKEAGQLQKDFNTYREKYKLGMRARTRGMNLGTVIVKGTPYHGVVGKESNDEFISVMHDSGFIKFPWKEVPDELRRQFGIEFPGDYSQRSFEAFPSLVEPQTFEEKVATHDRLMLEAQTKIQALNQEHAVAMQEHAKLINQISRAKLNKQDTLDLNRAKNINDAKLSNLKAQILSLSKTQSELIARDPRKKKA